MTESSTYYFSLALGPVQDFIAAALRTRDLWFGSYMLSEISKAAAQAMRENGAELIFPHVDNLADLEPNTPINVANQITGRVIGDKKKVTDILEQGKQGAKDRLSALIKEAETEYQNKIKTPALREVIWLLQEKPEELLELFSSWVRLKDSEYIQARDRLDQLSAARKNCREFKQSTLDPMGLGMGLPKSSLDGKRETVLESGLNTKQRLILRMGQGEQLDLMGLVKRMAGGKADQFTPTTRIAIDPWIRHIVGSDGGKEALASLTELLNNLKKSGFVTPVRGNKDAQGDSIYQDFPFDGGLLYPDRLDVALTASQKDDSDSYKQLKKLQTVLKPLWKQYGFPCPYYVLMLADGDHMGALITEARKIDSSDNPNNKPTEQSVTKLLGEFAQTVPETARNFQGHCIYAGGDDVLTFAPLDKALQLADKLRCDFYESLKDSAEQLNAEKIPTFSVGLVMAHMQTPLGKVRQLAARAEKLAKGNDECIPRNALGIIINPRSGAELEQRINWDNDPLTQLGDLCELYKTGELSSRFGYELREIGNLLHNMESDTAEDIKKYELTRVLDKKNISGGQQSLSEQTKQTVLTLAEVLPFDQVFNQHLIARWLATH